MDNETITGHDNGRLFGLDIWIMRQLLDTVPVDLWTGYGY